LEQGPKSEQRKLSTDCAVAIEKFF